MEIKKGIGVSPGVVISTAVVLDAEDFSIPERHVPPGRTDNEAARLHKAIEAAIAQIKVDRDAVAAKAGKEVAAIFDFPAGMLRDKSLIKQVEAEIIKQQTTAEYAVNVVLRRLANGFLKMSDRYLSERVKDIHDIERRLLHNLIGQTQQDL